MAVRMRGAATRGGSSPSRGVGGGAGVVRARRGRVERGQRGVQTVLYDETKHFEYVTGFAKRKNLRRLDAQTEKKDRARIDKIEQRKQTRDVALKQRRLQVPRLPSDSSEQEGNESGGDSGGDGDLNGNDQERGAMRQAHVLEQRTYADADGDGVITTTVKALGSRGVAEPIPVLTSDSSEESVTTLPQRAKGAHTRGTAQGEDNAAASEIQASVATEKSKHETGHARGPEKRSRPNSRNRFRSLSKHKTKGKGKATLSKGAGRPRTNAVRKSSGRR